MPLEAEVLVKDVECAVDPREALAQLGLGDDEGRRRVEERGAEEAENALVRQCLLVRGDGRVQRAAGRREGWWAQDQQQKWQTNKHAMWK